eukprot:1222092-Rhodomonas_salina.3
MPVHFPAFTAGLPLFEDARQAPRGQRPSLVGHDLDAFSAVVGHGLHYKGAHLALIRLLLPLLVPPHLESARQLRPRSITQSPHRLGWQQLLFLNLRRPEPPLRAALQDDYALPVSRFAQCLSQMLEHGRVWLLSFASHDRQGHRVPVRDSPGPAPGALDVPHGALIPHNDSLVHVKGMGVRFPEPRACSATSPPIHVPPGFQHLHRREEGAAPVVPECVDQDVPVAPDLKGVQLRRKRGAADLHARTPLEHRKHTLQVEGHPGTLHDFRRHLLHVLSRQELAHHPRQPATRCDLQQAPAS